MRDSKESLVGMGSFIIVAKLPGVFVIRINFNVAFLL